MPKLHIGQGFSVFVQFVHVRKVARMTVILTVTGPHTYVGCSTCSRFGSLHSEDHCVLGSMLGSRYLWKLQIYVHIHM